MIIIKDFCFWEYSSFFCSFDGPCSLGYHQWNQSTDQNQTPGWWYPSNWLKLKVDEL